MVSAVQAAELRTAQTGIRTVVNRVLTGYFNSLNLNRPEAARDALLTFVPTLVAQYGQTAADVAADWYDEMRAVESVPGRYRAEPQESPYTDAVDPMVRRAAGALFTADPRGALVTLTGSASKYVLAAGRQTIVTATDRDPRARGWSRVTRSGACKFCQMLAGRPGAVYTERSAHFAAHGDCNCASVPSWDPNAPEVDVAQYEASKRTTAMTPEEKAQHNALIRRAVEQYT